LRKVSEWNRPGFAPSARRIAAKLLAIWQSHRPRSLGDFYRRKRAHLSEQWLPRLLPDCSQWPRDFSLFAYDDWELNRAAQWLRWNDFLSYLPMILLKVDRGSMYHSLEVRVPLLDKEVVEVAMRVDWHSCLDLARAIGKLPLRAALARHVGHQTWIKRGFSAPMGAWLRGPFRPVFEDAVLEKGELLGLPVNTKAAREMFDRHLSEQADYGRRLWLLLSLALWEQYYRPRQKVAVRM